ncbi:hypothetical protein, partial [Psittacicella gerlachiana]
MSKEKEALIETLIGLNDKLEKRLKQYKLSADQEIYNLKQRVEDYQNELKNLEENFKIEASKVQKLLNENSNLIEQNSNLKLDLEYVSQDLRTQLEINKKEQETLNIISLGLGVQLKNLKQAFDREDYSEAKQYLFDFDYFEPVQSLLVNFKSYYDTLQNKAKDLSSKESTLKNESSRLKKEQVEFQANLNTYKQALEIRDFLIREKVISKNEPQDTLLTKLREALHPERSSLLMSLVKILFLLVIGAFILGISICNVPFVKKLFLSTDEIVKLEAPEPPKSKL